MARDQDFRLSDIAGISINVESTGFFVYGLLFNGVSLAFETVGEPIADFLFIVRD